ncbi:hypothetical protein SUGI_0730370, partial [Cryptomeria japonica]
KDSNRFSYIFFLLGNKKKRCKNLKIEEDFAGATSIRWVDVALIVFGPSGKLIEFPDFKLERETKSP